MNLRLAIRASERRWPPSRNLSRVPIRGALFQRCEARRGHPFSAALRHIKGSFQGARTRHPWYARENMGVFFRQPSSAASASRPPNRPSSAPGDSPGSRDVPPDQIVRSQDSRVWSSPVGIPSPSPQRPSKREQQGDHLPMIQPLRLNAAKIPIPPPDCEHSKQSRGHPQEVPSVVHGPFRPPGIRTQSSEIPARQNIRHSLYPHARNAWRSLLRGK